MSDRTFRSLLLLPVLLLLAAAVPVRAGDVSGSEPLTLRHAMELAEEHAPEVTAAVAARQVAAADLRLAKDAQHPEVVVSTTPGVARGLPLAVFGQVPAIAGLSAHQTLYDPADRYRLLESQAGTAAGDAQSEKTKQEAARATAVLYARCWTDPTLIETASRREQVLARSLERARAQAREGRLTELAVEQVHLRAERARLKRLGAEAERDLDRLELARRTGLPADGWTLSTADPAAELPSPIPAGDDLAAARAADPELGADAVALDLLGQGVALRSRGLAPVIGAEAQYYRLSTAYVGFYRRFRADDFSLALSIALPLWSSGRIADAAARAQASLQRKSEEQKARESELALAVRRAESVRDRAQAALSLARQGAALGAEDLRVTRALAAEGRTGEDEVDAKEAALADAQEEEVLAARDLFAGRVDLLALRGELVAAPVGASPPTAHP